MDKRVIKTKKVICNAFADLLIQKDINDITITELAEKAEVNRKTIYNYYPTTMDILNEIEDSLVASYEKIIDELDVSISLKDPTIIFMELTKVLNENLAFYSKLIKLDTNSLLVTKFGKIIIERLKQDFLKEKLFENRDVDFIITYIVNGMFAAYQYWFNSGMTLPIEEFSKKISKLVYNGINAFIAIK